MNSPRRYSAYDREPTERGWSDLELQTLERDHAVGMSVQQIVDVFATKGAHLTEATFRKYVQLGLLPRSRRVGRKGKHSGSQGLYPATAIRQLAHVRRLMSQGFTMDEIQREFLFVRGDIESLSRQLTRVYDALEQAARERVGVASTDPKIFDAIEELRAQGARLTAQLEGIEKRLTMHAQMARAVV